MIGPFRGGRVKAAVGVPSQPNVFYMGMVNGGVWKTTDYGRVWQPIFDEMPTGSIGAIDVSLSNPNVIYVGSGEGLHRPDLATGDGIYKSTDAGKTWAHVWNNNDQQIPRIAIDPTNPDRAFVAVLGHPYGQNPERGIYRTTDGGKSWEKVLYKDEYTGAGDVSIAPNDPNTIYASLWDSQHGPWENSAFNGPNSGLFKSTDGGTTWHQLTKGLPTAADGLGRIGIAISQSDPNRLYIIVGANRGNALYRSDDAGESWTVVTTDNRIAGKADDAAAPAIDPKNPDIIYSANTVAWKSIDGGKTWFAHRGAPGGDDYQRYWINPNNPDIILLVADQGAVITVNGGKTWSSWYNQPTAAMYHVAADNDWPYRLCSGQQDSGSACVSSRGNDGSIGYREFHPVGAFEYDYVAPDPLDPNIYYGGFAVSRYDRRTGQVQTVGPSAGGGRGGSAGAGPDYFRGVRTRPILFSPINKHKLYYGTNVVWETVNGGKSWKRISDDLSRATWDVPKNVGRYAGTPAAAVTQRGVVYTIAPSYVDSNTVWAGTDDGLIHVTRNGGKTWTDVTPPQIGPWWKVSIIDAGHHDANTAYAAINTFRLDDLRPHIFRTRDGGKTWTEIVQGIADGAIINTVKEDPKRKGLLFAGSETQVWFSLDDGDHWHSLRLNMPATSIRDLVVKDDDLALGTHGRGFYILDDITALRQWSAKAASDAVTLFKPANAVRVRYSMYPDTPVPPDEPMAENPPDGAPIDYYLKGDANGAVVIEILGEKGRVIRKYSSADPVEPPKDVGNWPYYWFRPAQVPAAKAGLQRFVWDLHYAPPGDSCTLPISATPFNTKCEPEGPWVHPGTYTVKLTVDGKSYTQPVTVVMDPRVKTPAIDLKLQSTLSLALYDAYIEAPATARLVRALHAQVADRTGKATGELATALGALAKSLDEIAGPEPTAGRGGFGGGRGGRGGPPAPDSFASVAAQLLPVMNVLQEADATPTTQTVAAANDRLKAFAALKARWEHILKTDVRAINIKLHAAGIEPVAMTAPRGVK
ncbi:MAG: glycoside hydrolase [Gemmatimonadetes bacterium]|nr:glycoside hydrolase [Gemmatimonadota bacterium]